MTRLKKLKQSIIGKENKFSIKHKILKHMEVIFKVIERTGIQTAIVLEKTHENVKNYLQVDLLSLSYRAKYPDNQITWITEDKYCVFMPLNEEIDLIKAEIGLITFAALAQKHYNF